MIPSQIRAHLKREPFQPVRICLSDGSSHEVRHPENALVTQYDIAIAIEAENGDLPERMVFCDPMHVTRIEPLPDTTGGGA